jgi:hypothetical protein
VLISFSPWGQPSGYQVTDFTFPLAQGASVTLSSTTPTVLWMTVYVAGLQCGRTTLTNSLTLTPSGQGAVTIPISLYVFDVLLDKQVFFRDLFLLCYSQNLFSRIWRQMENPNLASVLLAPFITRLNWTKCTRCTVSIV